MLICGAHNSKCNYKCVLIFFPKGVLNKMNIYFPIQNKPLAYYQTDKHFIICLACCDPKRLSRATVWVWNTEVSYSPGTYFSEFLVALPKSHTSSKL